MTLAQAIKLGLSDPTGENAKRFEAWVKHRNAMMAKARNARTCKLPSLELEQSSVDKQVEAAAAKFNDSMKESK